MEITQIMLIGGVFVLSLITLIILLVIRSSQGREEVQESQLIPESNTAPIFNPVHDPIVQVGNPSLSQNPNMPSEVVNTVVQPVIPTPPAVENEIKMEFQPYNSQDNYDYNTQLNSLNIQESDSNPVMPNQNEQVFVPQPQVSEPQMIPSMESTVEEVMPQYQIQDSSVGFEMNNFQPVNPQPAINMNSMQPTTQQPVQAPNFQPQVQVPVQQTEMTNQSEMVAPQVVAQEIPEMETVVAPNFNNQSYGANPMSPVTNSFVTPTIQPEPVQTYNEPTSPTMQYNPPVEASINNFVPNNIEPVINPPQMVANSNFAPEPNPMSSQYQQPVVDPVIGGMMDNNVAPVTNQSTAPASSVQGGINLPPVE